MIFLGRWFGSSTGLLLIAVGAVAPVLVTVVVFEDSQALARQQRAVRKAILHLSMFNNFS
jgi:hypothetical protein